MTALLDSDRQRLAKLFHAGERDAAGLAAHRLVQSHNATWFVTPTFGWLT